MVWKKKLPAARLTQTAGYSGGGVGHWLKPPELDSRSSKIGVAVVERTDSGVNFEHYLFERRFLRGVLDRILDDL